MAHDDSIAYQRMIQDIAEAERPYDWMRLAEKWMHLFENENQAYYCMEQAEKAVSTGPLISSLDWIWVAKEWSKIFGMILMHGEIYRCMANAEESVDDISPSTDWLRIAETYYIDFGDTDQAERCLRLAYNVAKSSYDWERSEKTQGKMKFVIANADRLADLTYLADKAPETRNMEKAERDAATSSEWAKLVMIWLQVFDRRSNALRCLGKAELAAGSVEDWVTVANTWAQEFDDKHQALWCLKQAVAIADSSDEWNTIADNLAAMGYSLRDQALNRKSS